MKCPKYIKQALWQRAKAAATCISKDCIVVEFLEKHGILVEEYDILGGCEMYVNPYSSAERVLEAIERSNKCRMN